MTRRKPSRLTTGRLQLLRLFSTLLPMTLKPSMHYESAPRNKVVVAIANKLARMAWAVLSSGQDYRHQPLQQLAAA